MEQDIICRYPVERRFSHKLKTDPLEKIFQFFLLSSFDSKEVYIISPWFSDFNLSNTISAQPYLSSTRNILKILDKLSSRGTRIHVLTRCIDEKINSELLNIMYLLQIKNPDQNLEKIRLPDMIKDYLSRELSIMREGIYAWIKLKEFSLNRGIDFKVDLGLPVRRYDSRLHSKIYVNDYMAIMGSSNFTRSGVVAGGNWECIMVVLSSNSLYNKIREYAVNYMSKGKDPRECEQRVISVLNQLPLEIISMNDLIELLNYIIYKLETREI